MNARALNRWITRLATMAAVVLIVAFVYARRDSLRGYEPAPATSDSSTYWYCRACKLGFALTAAEYEGRVQLGAAPETPRKGEHALVRNEPLVRCPKCGGLAVAARRCLADSSIFDARPPGGTTGVCPKCGWNPFGG